MPVGGCEGERGHAEDDEGTTEEQVAGVEKGAGQHAEDDDEEALHAADPGDGAGGGAGEQGGEVDLLEGAEGLGEAPRRVGDQLRWGGFAGPTHHALINMKKVARTYSQALSPLLGGCGSAAGPASLTAFPPTLLAASPVPSSMFFSEVSLLTLVSVSLVGRASLC